MEMEPPVLEEDSPTSIEMEPAREFAELPLLIRTIPESPEPVLLPVFKIKSPLFESSLVPLEIMTAPEDCSTEFPERMDTEPPVEIEEDPDVMKMEPDEEDSSPT